MASEILGAVSVVWHMCNCIPRRKYIWRIFIDFPNLWKKLNKTCKTQQDKHSYICIQRKKPRLLQCNEESDSRFWCLIADSFEAPLLLTFPCDPHLRKLTGKPTYSPTLAEMADSNHAALAPHVRTFILAPSPNHNKASSQPFLALSRH